MIVRKRADQALREDGYLLDIDGNPRTFVRLDLAREDHCCDAMFNMVQMDDYLIYDSTERCWALITRNPWVESLSHCPFCATRLPLSLSDTLLVEVEKQVGHEEFQRIVDELSDWPAEFMSDQWWKDRKL